MENKETLVVVSKVKKHFNETGLRSSADFTDSLSDVVAKILNNAGESAKKDGRKTVMPKDLEN